MHPFPRNDDSASNGVVPLLLALLCFAVAGPALVVAFVALHVWLAATIVLRLIAGAYVRAVLWGGVLAALFHIDCQLVSL